MHAMASSRSTLRSFVFSLFFLSTFVTGHTWVEQLMAIAPNGTFVGEPGFPRNNVLRTSSAFSDTAMVFLIPPNGGPPNQIDANQLMCRREQTTPTQSAGSPRLKAAPGQAVALRYQENGHVTLPQNQPGKPENRGANFVYFTTQSKPDDKFLQIHRQWSADGKGGDGRGRLISTRNFDDGQCYQVNGEKISKQRQAEFKHAGDTLQGQALWCQQDIQIPTDAAPGSTITLYWVWDWPTMPGTAGFPDGKQEIYTTCMDIDIVAPAAGQGKALSQGYVKQDLANAAIPAQLSDIANPTAIKAQMIPFAGVNAANSSTTPEVISIVPTQQTRSASSSSTTRTRDPSTVTVVPSSSRTRKGRPTVTVTETTLMTIYVTRSTSELQASATAISLNSVVSVRPVSDPVSTAVVSSVKTIECDSIAPSSDRGFNSTTTSQKFRLRGRNPFYIVPAQDRPAPASGASSQCK